ncbi:hypothetical protein pEaSNUABM39_00089 [Erwinia phage pEa_SNUABM_39]|nr:hypothetical protein pEaSNUABM39_00089 [Erwinia phage pEa_SNUABM_39]
MLFVSNGSQLLEKKIEIARKRMFLFASDVVPPDRKSSYTDLIDKINKSRSFCALADVDRNMKCVRIAGWRAGRLYYNYVPSALISNSLIEGTNTKQVSATDMFCRYYSIGRDDYVGNAWTGSCSLLPTLSNGATTLPGYFDMVLPAFDGTVFACTLNQTNDNAITTSASSSGTINGPSSGIGRWSEDISSYIQNIYLTTTASPEVLTLTYSSASMGSISAKTQYNLGTVGAAWPRLFSAYRTRVYGTYYFSGGGWSYSTTNSAGAYGSSQVTVPENIYFGTGTTADTPAVDIAWGMMPIAFDVKAPVYAVVSKVNTDFAVAGPVLPTEILTGTFNTYEPVVLPKRFTL